MNNEHIEPDDVRIDVHPTPTRAEAAAIVVALRAATREQPRARRAPILSVWQRAVRSDALRSEMTHEDSGWRRVARLEH